MCAVNVKLPDLHWRVLSVLADGFQHSGQSIADALGVSRSAVWKSLAKLEQKGVDICHARGVGYQLTDGALELIDARSIGDQGLCEAFQLDVLTETPSTNQWLLERLPAGPLQPRICLAEHQLKGRGRRGRAWYAPFGLNLNYSIAWPFERATFLSGLSLAVGVLVLESLAGLGVTGVMLKWPNDLLVDGKKIAGILIELRGEVGGVMWAVIGIGINVNMVTDEGLSIDQPWTSCRQVLGRKISRNDLVKQLTGRLHEGLNLFQISGLGPFLDRWRKFDWLQNKSVMIECQGERVAGIARGISGDGSLVAAVGSRVINVSGGEVTVRVAD